MSRADAFDAFYRESRARLLHQTYAYVGDTEVAQRALADAFVAAGQHWRKLADDPDKDAWMRERAFRASSRAQNRGRQPWYTRALNVADEHRPLVVALAKLPGTDRRLVILTHLVGLELVAASREAGVTTSAAEASLRSSMDVLAEGGVPTEAGALHASLQSLRQDLSETPAERAPQLRREGSRRRRSQVLLVGICSLAIAVGAGALTVAQPAEKPAPDTDVPAAVDPLEEPEPEVSVSQMLPVSETENLDRGRPWKVGSTSWDLGVTQPYDACLAAVPNDPNAEHFWLRDFTAGGKKKPTEVTQAIEVSRNDDVAARNYDGLVEQFSVCAGRQLINYRLLGGIGDQARMITLRGLEDGRLQTQHVAIAQTGTAVTVWNVRAPDQHPVPANRVIDLLGASAAELCTTSAGSCGSKPYRTLSEAPPPVGSARGFLSVIDLPLFEDVPDPWAATDPIRVRDNPSATECDQADFVDAGASAVRSRTYVIPQAKNLPDLFGMTETVGQFPGNRKAELFLESVAESVNACEQGQRSIQLTSNDTFQTSTTSGRVWEVELSASEDRTVTFRTALVQVRDQVAQITFTPSESVDMSQEEFVDVAIRAAQRMGEV